MKGRVDIVMDLHRESAMVGGRQIAHYPNTAWSLQGISHHT